MVLPAAAVLVVFVGLSQDSLTTGPIWSGQRADKPAGFTVRQTSAEVPNGQGARIVAAMIHLLTRMLG